MNVLIWSEDYSVGIPAIDNEHKFLASLLNDMNRALDTDKSVQIQMVNDALNNLSNCIHRHFESEENFLLLNHYPKYEKHKAEHIDLFAQLDLFKKSFKDNKHSFSEGNLLFLQDWLVRHIILHDCEFGLYFRGKKLAYNSE